MRSSARPARAWVGLAALLGLGALLAWRLPSGWLDWQPGRAGTQPWRWWTAAFVHWSAAHLLANLGGALLVGALGWVASLPQRLAWAWFVAWPLTHLALGLQPGLRHYGGLSGVLHAGVAVAAVWLALRGRGLHRWVGAALAAGLVAKVVLEAPWSGPLRQMAGWDIPLAPLAHATGALAGALCALAAERLGRGGRR